MSNTEVGQLRQRNPVTPAIANRGAIRHNSGMNETLLCPNNRPQIGCIGVGSMGVGDAAEHVQFGDTVPICDVDAHRREAAKGNSLFGRRRADAYNDYRKILDRKDIDVVSIATPEPKAGRILGDDHASGFFARTPRQGFEIPQV
jgi:hypothetical protein